MTPEYILQQLIRLGEKMRTAQKNFFATKSYEAEKKQNYYSESKIAERQFDQLLDQAKKILKQPS
jgi:hypothetical protein